MIFPYILGAILYSIAVCLAYSGSFKESKWYFLIGIAVGVLANYIWLWIAKHSPDKHQIYISGLIWDSVLVGAYTLIPIMFFGVRFTNLTALGVILIVSGFLVIKIAG